MPQMAAICINVEDPRLPPTDAAFDPEHAIRAEEIGAGDGSQAYKIKSVPPVLANMPGQGDILSRNSNGEWERRQTVQGSDERFVKSSSGYLVAAHRAQTPAMLSPIQVWVE